MHIWRPVNLVLVVAGPYNSLFERLIANTHEPENEQACWLWKGALHYKGYGHFNIRVGGKHMKCYAHRAMAEIMLGRKLEPNEEPDHLCLNRRCINPDHLDPVPRKVNNDRRVARVMAARRGAKVMPY